MITVRTLAALLLLAGCLPPDPVAGGTTPKADADLAALAHRWTIVDHVLGDGAQTSDADARALTGRVVEITADGFVTPWHGHCDDAGRQHRGRTLGEVVADEHLPHAPPDLAGELVEYRLSCTINQRVPTFVIYVAGERALTCWSHACYLLRR
jgi:hypothetical protein